jgi:RNase H-fold protein (predicted Holliday junction resolvase)
MKDFLIICSGTNYIDRNYSSNAFKNITNFVKSVNHTTIILISVPHRHDVTEYTHVNSTIKSFNSKLVKLDKFSAMLAQLKLSTIDFYLPSMDCI